MRTTDREVTNPRHAHKAVDSHAGSHRATTRSSDRTGHLLTPADVAELHAVNVENAVAGYAARKPR